MSVVDTTEMAQSSLNDIVTSLYQRVQLLEDVLSIVGEQSQETHKRKAPLKTQAATEYGMSRALCVETIDPKKENRVRYFHPRFHEPETSVLSLPFARPISNMGGFDDCGLSWVPPAGSTLCLVFSNGVRNQAFYLGTTWHRYRGNSEFGYAGMREWQELYEGNRGGYLVGDDNTQVLPPWNTENYNGPDIDDPKLFLTSPLEQRRTTFPNIYGFKTPEKHMLKMVDGDAKCNRRWKRMELLSGCGNWMIFKDDHLHYGGQWANPKCPPDPGGSEVDLCSDSEERLPFFTDLKGSPIEGDSLCSGGQRNESFQVVDADGTRTVRRRFPCTTDCGVSCGNIIAGHPSTPNPPSPVTSKYNRTNQGANPWFKHANECRPYKGPGTPQNNRCTLPQSGIQMMSISGHTWVMDDSVEEPRGKPEWQRSLGGFDYGCNDKYLGVMWMKSSTGHLFAMSDVESSPKLRGDQNFIKLLTASGNKIELNDHTEPDRPDTCPPPDCPSCPPHFAGEERGIHLQSTSNHVIKMIDHLNRQCAPCRQEGGIPENNATQAYIQIRSGYGTEMRFSDDFSQRETQQQWIQIFHPQCAGDGDNNCNSCDTAECRGPHILRFQGRPKGQPGVVYLRAGGHAIRQTYDMDIVLVGDKERNPSDKFTYVSQRFFTAVEDVHFRYSGELHIFFAEKKILLLAGRDCPPPEGKRCKGPCLYSVIVSRCPVVCPLTGITHWTDKSMSERVFASAYNVCQTECGEGPYEPTPECSDYFERMQAAQGPPCEEEEEMEIDTGTGNVSVPVQTPPSEG